MTKFLAGCAGLALLAAPALALDDEQIGTIDAVFDGAEISLPTVIRTSGEESSPSAYLLVIGAGMSSLAMLGAGADNAQFVVDATFMSETPGAESATVSPTIQYSPGTGGAFWTSEDAPTPPVITFDEFGTDGVEGRASGAFNGVLCYAESYESGPDTSNCKPVEGRFDTRIFVERP